MAHRDVLKEIAELRKRNLRGKSPYVVAFRRIRPVLDGLHLVSRKKAKTIADKEFVRGVPVSLVACMEGYFRHHAARLIDSGRPFLQNAGGFKDVRLTLDSLLSTHAKRVTVGELIVHGLKVSSIEDIDRMMSTILDRPFLATLKKQGLENEAIAAISEVFRKRHIVAHELAPGLKIDSKKTLDEAYSVFALLLSSNMYIEARLGRLRSAA